MHPHALHYRARQILLQHSGRWLGRTAWQNLVSPDTHLVKQLCR
jgi:hypothetical protein